jgi:hypothetical protein
MLACDFFAVDAVLLRLLYVLFFIELDTRKVYVTGVTEHPTGAWVVQQARSLAYELSERVQPVKYLIRDRGTKFTAASARSSDPTAPGSFGRRSVPLVPTPSPSASSALSVGSATTGCSSSIACWHVRCSSKGTFDRSMGSGEAPGRRDG